MIAALDTSGPAAAFAVGDDDGNVLLNCGDLPVGRASASLLDRLLQALTEAGLRLNDIRRWHVGLGPGSFTGIRMGAALVQGICTGSGATGAGLPSSLGLVRQGAGQAGTAASLHDGRRRELIVCEYKRTGNDWEPNADPRIIGIDAVDQLDADVLVMAAGDRARPQLPPDLDRLHTVPGIDAAALLAAAPAADPDMRPVYVRPPVFVPPTPSRS